MFGLSVRRALRTLWVVAAACIAITADEAATAQLPFTEQAPERARVAFATDTKIFTVAADGSGRRFVADGTEPAWSPDRSAIAFTRLATDADTQHTEVWAAAPDGSGARRISSVNPSALDAAPAWSPDGQRVAFVRLTFRGDQVTSTIVSAAAGGGDERRIVRVPSARYRAFTHLAWSPNGARILATETFLTAEETEEAQPALHTVEVASGRRTRLLANGGQAAFSPDGGRIAFSALRPGCEADQCHELYVADADGRGKVRLTNDESDDRAPSWSADGSRIAFASMRNSPYGEQPEIYSIQPDGGCLTWLTNGTVRSTDPSWEPGATLSTDPGGCGAVPREPLIETDTADLARYRSGPIWWLGMRFGNLLLTDADVARDAALLSYGDCAAFEPSQCAPGFGLDSMPVCGTEVLEFADPKTLVRHGGALVAHPELVEVDHPTVFTGPTYVGFEGLGDERIPREVLDNLRRYGDDAPPAGGLPRAELPRRTWRSLEAMRARVRKYGSVAAVAKRFRVSRSTVKHRLALDRALRKLGPFGRLDCAKR